MNRPPYTIEHAECISLALFRDGLTNMRVLHITPWYPSSLEPYRALFIQRHIESLEGLTEQVVLHLDLESSDPRTYKSPSVRHVGIKSILPGWRLKELKAALVIKSFLKSFPKGHFTHVVFHIAYPSLVHSGLFENYLPQKRFVLEHWSIYHFNFYSVKPPRRLQSLFKSSIRLITVSESLKRDIQNFTGRDIQASILPNVVDTSVFRRVESERGQHFLMMGLWKEPKNPMPVLEAIATLHTQGKSIYCKIGGYGPLWQNMKSFVTSHQIDHLIEWIESPSEERIAQELNTCTALILPSDYETFSVLSAEALCCGTPVLANRVGALPEIIDEQNGMLVDSHHQWAEVLAGWHHRTFDSMRIAVNAQQRFNKQKIGAAFHAILQSS